MTRKLVVPVTTMNSVDLEVGSKLVESSSSDKISTSTATPQQQQSKPAPSVVVVKKQPPPVPPRYKIITSFEELSNLKARSRIPIDINTGCQQGHANPYGMIGPVVTAAALISNFNDLFFRSTSQAAAASPMPSSDVMQSSTAMGLAQHFGNSNMGAQQIQHNSTAAADATSTRLRANLPTLSTSINFSSLMMSSSTNGGSLDSRASSSSSASGAATSKTGQTSSNVANSPLANNSTQQPQTKYFSFMTTNKLFSNYTSQSNLKVGFKEFIFF